MMTVDDDLRRAATSLRSAVRDLPLPTSRATSEAQPNHVIVVVAIATIFSGVLIGGVLVRPHGGSRGIQLTDGRRPPPASPGQPGTESSRSIAGVAVQEVLAQGDGWTAFLSPVGADMYFCVQIDQPQGGNCSSTPKSLDVSHPALLSLSRPQHIGGPVAEWGLVDKRVAAIIGTSSNGKQIDVPILHPVMNTSANYFVVLSDPDLTGTSFVATDDRGTFLGSIR
jgi:hypothetical protein